VRLYREGLTRLLSGHSALTVVGAAPLDPDALPRVAAERPDVVLLEAAAACETQVTQDLARIVPDATIVAYGLVDEERQALRCAEAGVMAFVSGEATSEQLIGAILGARRGEVTCSPRVAALLMRRVRALTQGLAPDRRHPALTPRERGIIGLIAEGLSNKEIGARLGIELCTVKNHVHNILEKLNVTRRSQAVARVRRSRLLWPVPEGGQGTGS
jgi:DNA-binding NarL/FixJ family response regulator